MYEKILENLYRIEIPLPNNPLKGLNVYLLQGYGRNLLIDTGFRIPECRDVLKQALKELNADQPLDILLTHMHADHSGLAPELVSKDGKIRISRLDAPWLDVNSAGELRQAVASDYAAAGLPERVEQSFWYRNRGYSVGVDTQYQYTLLDDGEEIQVGNYKLRAVLVPGHTPGNMCFWMKEQGIMFTGDHVLFDITPNITVWPGMEDMLGKYLDSLIKIQNYPVKLALPGHRETGEFGSRINELIRHHKERLEEIMHIVAEHPGLTIYDITGWMSWNIRARNWEEFPDSQKFYAIGECMAHLEYLYARDMLSRRRNGRIYYYTVQQNALCKME